MNEIDNKYYNSVVAEALLFRLKTEQKGEEDDNTPEFLTEVELKKIETDNIEDVIDFFRGKVSGIVEELRQTKSESLTIVKELLELVPSLKKNNQELEKTIEDMKMEREISLFLEEFTAEVMREFVEFDYENLIDVIDKNDLKGSIEFFYSELFNIIFESIVEKMERLLDPIKINALVFKYIPTNLEVPELSPIAKIRIEDEKGQKGDWREDPIVFDNEESREYYDSSIKGDKENSKSQGIHIISSEELDLTKEGDKELDETEIKKLESPNDRLEFDITIRGQGTEDDTAQFILKTLDPEKKLKVSGVVDIIFNKGGLNENPLLKNEFLMKSFQQALNNSFLALEMLTNIVVRINEKLENQKGDVQKFLDALKQLFSHRIGNALNIIYGGTQLEGMKLRMGKEINLQDFIEQLEVNVGYCVGVFHAILQDIAEMQETGEYFAQDMGIGDANKKMITGSRIQKASERQNSNDGSKDVPIETERLW